MWDELNRIPGVSRNSGLPVSEAAREVVTGNPGKGSAVLVGETPAELKNEETEQSGFPRGSFVSAVADGYDSNRQRDQGIPRVLG